MANFKLNQTGEQIQADLNLLDSNSATQGQVLTADGTGKASWQNASGGSGGTQWYKHTIDCSTDDDYIVYIVLIDTNGNAYNALTRDFMLSLVANNKYIFYNGTSYLQLFADVAAVPPGQTPPSQTPPSQTPLPPEPQPGYTLTTYYLRNKSFVSFTINSITSDDVTPL